MGLVIVVAVNRVGATNNLKKAVIAVYEAVTGDTVVLPTKASP